jgi:homopolymeric O-antigen transport system permease protein
MSGSSKLTVVYTPSADLGLGWHVWRDMARAVYDSRELTWQLFVRNWRARFRQSFLGYAWTLGTTLATVAMFTLLRGASIIRFGETQLPYPLYVLIGFTVWQLFADSLTRATNSIVTTSKLISKINFTRETVVLSAVGEAAFDFSLRFVVVIAAFPLFGLMPSWGLLAVPLLLVPLVLFSVGLGMILSVANSVLRDFGNALPVLLPFGMFLTPVLYPVPTTWPGTLLVKFNPVASYVMAARDLAVGAGLAHLGGYAAWSVASVVLCLAGWRFFHLAMPRVIERL